MLIEAGRRTLGLALLGAVLLALTVASSAQADSASIAFTDAAGNSDPAVGVGRTLTVKANSAVSKFLYVKVRPSGGAPCAPSASSDAASGQYYGSFSGDGLYGEPINGDITLRKTGTWDTPGSFQYCFWLASSSSAPATPFTQTLTFRRPTGSISATVAPISPQAGQPLTITIAGSSEAPKHVYSKIRAAGGAPCAPSASADSGNGLIYGSDVNGTFSLPTTTPLGTAGAYLICMWLADSSSDGTPVAGPQPATFTVTEPPRPCVVPPLPRFTLLAPYLTALAAANCTAGTQRYTPSLTYPRGTIIKTTPVPGTSLAPGAPVALLISRGKRCRVPAATPGTTLSRARTRLRAAGCVPGSVRNVRSNRRRGTVVRFTPRSGTTLSPRAVVGIRLSRGRGR